MITRSKSYVWLLFTLLIVLMAAAYVLNVYYNKTPSKTPFSSQLNDNQAGAGYITVRDQQGRVILETGMPVYPEDEYISEDNTHYVIISVQGANAIAQPKHGTTSSNHQSSSLIAPPSKEVPAVATNKPRHVCIYHTHSDESFIPTSGTESKPGDGDIFQVGAALGDALSKSGVTITQSPDRHDPHDINAYNRSRRTAAQLLKEQPDAIFDIHRDSAPGEAYSTSVNGIMASRVMIVVGQSNPNMATNLEFASQVKDAADALYPDLMRGIFIGHGDYNQDLYPTALLFEVGSQSISVDDADKAVNCLADAVLTVLNSR